MYTVSVPITNRYPNREPDEEGILRELERAGAARVWLCSARGIENEETLRDELRLIRKHKAFFEARGLEVGVWICSLGHGMALSHELTAPEGTERYEKIVGLTGESCPDSLCPSGEAFARDYSRWIARIAQTGVKLIMLDDDYRLGIRPSLNGCCCERHMARYRARVGENISQEEMSEKIFRGRPDKYREAWLDMNRDALLFLAKRIRREVDAVSPETRVGVCAVMSTWETDGVTAIEIAKALAGGTRPFLRTIGAPYWASAGRRLHEIINQTRLQRYWCENEDIELFTEGDVYPRPRYSTPASYLEMFDMALRADGGFDGILKYMLDYTSSPGYERGYVDRMLRNRPAYEWIEKNLSGGKAEGADVVCRPGRVRTARIAPDVSLEDVNAVFHNYAAEELLSNCGIPLAFGTRGVHAACGEDARQLTDEMLNDGVVLDASAAAILLEKGIDIGASAIDEPRPQDGAEYDIETGEYVVTGGARHFRKPTLKQGALPFSELGGLVSGYRYENARGQRFVVFAFEADAPFIGPGLLRAYTRQKQVIEGIEWAGRHPLPAVCLGQPDILMICKRFEDGLSVGLWNLSPDYIPDARIRLDARYESVSIFGAEGELKDNTLSLRGDIPPYAFAGFKLTRRGSKIQE